MKPLEVLVLGVAAGVAAFVVMQYQGGDAQQAKLIASDISRSLAATATMAKSVFMEVIGMRGINNNNPGNIRRSNTGVVWQGQSAEQSDPAFVQFDTPEYGIRALSKLLDTYSQTYGLNTVQGIISRYAPSSENNTAAYVASVAGAIGVKPDQAINVQQNKAALVQAIIRHENGIQPYSLATINNGIAMA